MLSSVQQNLVDYDPEQPIEHLLERVPPAWCVYRLADADGRPVQLLCVKNLRASLKRRLGEPDGTEEPNRRIDYRALVRQVAWTRVDSVFEQDVVYLEHARRLFPESYAAVLGFRPAWFVHVDPEATHPRFTRTNDLAQTSGRYFGPLPEKHAAQKLVHTVEDLFDLCRDPAALAAAPAGPCQWRQMNKCVGPCDGSIDLAGYRALVAHAADVLGDVGRTIENQTLRMRQAAAAMEYEAAGRIKGFVERLEELRGGNCRQLRPLEKFRFLAVMPGPRNNTAKLFAITPNQITPLACLTQPPVQRRGEEVLRTALAVLSEPASLPLDAAAFERISLVAHHLFPSRKVPGVFIAAAELHDRTLAAAFREVNKPAKAKESSHDEEGEVRGLQAI